ncbi:FMN reductase domain-containing protein [Rhizobium gallicum]|uniref:FMN reductase domain-containing protein n=1 Tax=Rhizobium gallicum TaxID=56730 RepID=A0A1L5NHM7_9HYPH|nr:FMN reductase domain-containing protein [Rhizobium gallicum]
MPQGSSSWRRSSFFTIRPVAISKPWHMQLRKARQVCGRRSQRKGRSGPAEEMGVDEIKGGSPHGASTITDGDGSRQPSAIELEDAKYQVAHVAKIAAKLG